MWEQIPLHVSPTSRLESMEHVYLEVSDVTDNCQSKKAFMSVSDYTKKENTLKKQDKK